MLLSSLIDVPAGELAGVLAADESRCCLRERLARVPDPRSRRGRWHPLEFVLALAICAFTAAGHDSPAAVAEWAVGCSQDALAVLGGRRDPWIRRIRPPSVRAFSRVFKDIDAEAFNVALYGYLAAMPVSPPGALPAMTRHEREQRRAAAAAARPGPHREPAQCPCRHPQPGHRRLPPGRVRQHRPRPPLLRPRRPAHTRALRIHLNQWGRRPAARVVEACRPGWSCQRASVTRTISIVSSSSPRSCWRHRSSGRSPNGVGTRGNV